MRVEMMRVVYKQALLIVIGAMMALASPVMAAVIPAVSVDEAILEYLEFTDGSGALIGDAFVFPAVEVSTVGGVPVTGSAFLDLNFDFDTNDITDVGGGFFLDDANGEVLSGTVESILSLPDQIQLRFGDLTGAAASLFPNGAFGVITFLDAAGADALAFLTSGQSFRVGIAIFANPAPVPLPAGFVLFAITLVAGAGVRRASRS